MKEMIIRDEDVLEMLDSLLNEQNSIDWNSFYMNREKKIPFFKNDPDENLVDYFERDLISAGRTLELGCGPGRNAIFLAENGCRVDAVDSSKEGLEWAKERAKEKNVEISFIEEDIFQLDFDEGSYDLVYDSGCFHHIPPHRRLGYLNLIKNALRPGGHFALTCFVEGGDLGGSMISDWEVYRQRSMQGGLGYSEAKLKEIFKEFEPVEARLMRDCGEDEGLFGVSGLRTALFQKKFL
ncbi:class I SAM-dependent methyltransferase [Bacillus sp. AK031]